MCNSEAGFSVHVPHIYTYVHIRVSISIRLSHVSICHVPTFHLCIFQLSCLQLSWFSFHSSCLMFLFPFNVSCFHCSRFSFSFWFFHIFVFKCTCFMVSCLNVPWFFCIYHVFSFHGSELVQSPGTPKSPQHDLPEVQNYSNGSRKMLPRKPKVPPGRRRGSQAGPQRQK